MENQDERITFWFQPLGTWKRIDSVSSRHVSKEEMIEETKRLVEDDWKISFGEGFVEKVVLDKNHKIC